jgi:hypothetical protein
MSSVGAAASSPGPAHMSTRAQASRLNGARSRGPGTADGALSAECAEARASRAEARRPPRGDALEYEGAEGAFLPQGSTRPQAILFCETNPITIPCGTIPIIREPGRRSVARGKPAALAQLSVANGAAAARLFRRAICCSRRPM